MIQILADLFANATILLTRVTTGVQAHWIGCGPEPVPRIYYANHTSHGDFVLIWTVLPPVLRKTTRPVAGADYWQTGPMRRFVAVNVFRSVLIDRQQPQCGYDPVTLMSNAVDAGASLILFPEGTRNTTDARLLPFKGGIYHLARKRPEVELVPVWLANLNRVLPKGEIIPVPLLCTVTFGAPLKLRADEARADFLARTRSALLGLASSPSRQSDTSQ